VNGDSVDNALAFLCLARGITPSFHDKDLAIMKTTVRSYLKASPILIGSAMLGLVHPAFTQQISPPRVAPIQTPIGLPPGRPVKLPGLVPSVKINNYATGAPSQISITWEASSNTNAPLSVTLTSNNVTIYSNNNVSLAPRGIGYDSGPQTIPLSSLMNIGGAFVVGLNTVQIAASQPTGGYTASATFVLPVMQATMPNAPVAETPMNLGWRLVELLPQDPPDSSVISLNVMAAGQTIYPALGAASVQVPSCYNQFHPDSTNSRVHGWYSDCGMQSIQIQAPDYRSPAGLQIDAAGGSVPMTVTATVTDTNGQSAFPLHVGPFPVQITPIAAGQVPQFPITVERKDFLTSSGARWMDTTVTIHQDGSISGQTRTVNAVQFDGYHGCVALRLFDKNGLATGNPPPANAAPLWTNNPGQRYGVDGASLGMHDRTDVWSAQISPGVLSNLISYVEIYHYLCPNSAAQDFKNWFGPIQQSADEVTKVYAAASKAVGGSGSSNSSAP